MFFFFNGVELLQLALSHECEDFFIPNRVTRITVPNPLLPPSMMVIRVIRLWAEKKISFRARLRPVPRRSAAEETRVFCNMTFTNT